MSSESGIAPYESIAVIGGGAWGTALAMTAIHAGRDVTLYAREPEVVSSIRSHHENTMFLPGLALPPQLRPTSDLKDCAQSQAILLVAPAQHVRSSMLDLREHFAAETPIVICAKGIEKTTGKLLTDVVAEVAPKAEVAMLSGPSFARDVALGLPTAVTIAASEGVGARLQASLSHGAFRPYTSTDLIGVALGGAAKNVYAIACGMVEGAGLGENARAALLARSFAEILRLGAVLGAQPQTLGGLSGLGDLVLTAMSTSSRNYSLGFALGEGKTLATLLGSGRPLAEGAYTAAPLVKRATDEGVEMPIAEAIAGVLDGKLQLPDAVRLLMSRPLRNE